MAAPNIPDAVSDDLNYEEWAPTAKATLTEEGLWDIVENGVSPDPSKIPELSATIQAEQLSRWRDLVVKDTKAIQILQSSLTDSAFRKTISASSAKEVWDLLEKGNEEAKLRRLENKFEQLSMGERESVDSYFDRVTEIVEKLRRLKIEKSDYEVIKKVLATLSGSYDGVAPVLEELMDVHKMTFKSLVEFFHRYDSITEEDVHLMLKANRLKWEAQNKNNHNQNQEDRISTSAKWSGPKQFRRNKGVCFECGEKGHKARDCNGKNQQPAATEARKRGECVVRDRTGAVFGETMWDERGLSLRLQGSNFSYKQRYCEIMYVGKEATNKRSYVEGIETEGSVT
ncbi:unnamed protein product [Arabis nemorensis]|uniref:CCHC-type domain-containing protein n=1 Tax=Arabis nemorensis TaxID=586526 RepID=A0A565BDL5_9BRAS|nr:unnamed protein product [Arabis nemorensis]